MGRLTDAMLGKGAEYPLHPGWKAQSTSADAAQIIAPVAQIIRDKALLAIKSAGARGLTADECANVIKEPWPSVRPRVSELSALQLIRKSNLPRRPSHNGRSQIVWIAT